jgi:hypothetical protein
MKKTLASLGLFLPAVCIGSVAEERPIFTNAGSVDSAHYEISLGWIL